MGVVNAFPSKTITPATGETPARRKLLEARNQSQLTGSIRTCYSICDFDADLARRYLHVYCKVVTSNGAA